MDEFIIFRNRKYALHSAKERDESLDHLTRQELERRLGPPSGLVTHVVYFGEGQYGIRTHSWNQRCLHCSTK